jgi:hypothetical protein
MSSGVMSSTVTARGSITHRQVIHSNRPDLPNAELDPPQMIPGCHGAGLP